MQNKREVNPKPNTVGNTYVPPRPPNPPSAESPPLAHSASATWSATPTLASEIPQAVSQQVALEIQCVYLMTRSKAPYLCAIPARDT
jgi:hypothetical protein